MHPWRWLQDLCHERRHTTYSSVGFSNRAVSSLKPVVTHSFVASSLKEQQVSNGSKRKKRVEQEAFTLEESLLFLDESDFLFWFLNMSEKASNPKGPPGPKDERLIVAALAASGLNTGSGFFSASALLESGTTPSCPWKSLKAVSKLGPSSNIGP